MTDVGMLGGRVALVTGGGRGIGRAIALGLARAGADVAVAARTMEQLRAVAAEISALGRQSHAFALDIGDRTALAAAPAEVARVLGPVDILVNNAGIAESQPLHKMDDALWDRHLALDLTAPFLLTRACLPSMYQRGFGRVINVASIAGKIGFEYTAAYCAAKHGLIGLTRTLALEGAKHGVTANALCPGWTETEMLEVAVRNVAAKTGRTRDEALATLVEAMPIDRAVTPEEVATVAVLMAGNGGINGQSINIDGGEVMS